MDGGNSEGKVVSSYTTQKSTAYGYDGYGRTKKQTSPTGLVNTYTYSKSNEVTKVTSNLGPDQYMKYDKYGNLLSTEIYDPDATTKPTMYSETAYTSDGNFVKSETDGLGNVTTYEYDTLDGQILSTTHPKREGKPDVVTYFEYNDDQHLESVRQGDRSIGYVYGEFDDLTGIEHNGFSYDFTYDKFGNLLTASIADRVICTNEYSPYNGNLIRSVFADGSYTGCVYDEYGRVVSNSMNGTLLNKYEYDNDGNVSKETDYQGNVTTKFDYNDTNQVVRTEVYSGDSTKSDDFESRMQYTYTVDNQVSTLSYQEKDEEIRTYTFTYAKDGRQVKSTAPDKSSTEWSYDSLRRINKAIYTPKSGAATGKKLYTTVTYTGDTIVTADGKSKKVTSGQISGVTNRFGTSGTMLSQYAATYDEWGNITRLEDTAAKANGKSESIRTYEYNDYGEVTKAVESYENGQKNIYTYTYDAGGNILTETVNGTKHTYKYDSVWKDKLISYDGKTITYNELGCPVNYMGSTMKWDVNGSLSEIKKGGTTITYTYMGDGQRRSKTVNGVTTTYHYNNGMLLSQTTGDETLRYYYDNGGKAASIVYSKGDGEERSYFYVRNLQGDVIGICRSSDSKLIGTYEYDLWGKPIGIKEATPGIDTDGILEKNPLRYRSYYYDSETGFYNLNARYYDPAIRRFISADSPTVLMIATVSLDCKNLFSYAENNPVMAKDSSGGVAETVFDVITISISVVEVCVNPADPWAWAGLAGDCIDLIPFVTGVGEGIKGLKVVVKIANKTADVADAVNDGKKVVKAADKVSDSVKQLDNVSDAAKAAKSSKPKVHGNSKLSTKPQHGYEIYNTETGDVVKTGISGQKLNLNGTSPRANSQVNKLNKSTGTQLYDARIVETDMPNRLSALEWERENALRLWNEGNFMSLHKRPRPWEE